MTYVEEDYSTIKGDYTSLQRGYNVHDAASERAAIDATWAYLNSNNQLYEPPWDGIASSSYAVNERLYLSNISIAEVDLTDVNRVNLTGKFKTVANWTQRALCPQADMNVSTETVRVTSSLGTETIPGPGFTAENFRGAIEPNTDRTAVKGANAQEAKSDINLVWNPIPPLNTRHSGWIYEYARNASSMVGKTNLTKFLDDSQVGGSGFAGYAIGELIFLGWTGKVIDQKYDLYEFRYRFGYSEVYQRSGDVIGGITIPGSIVQGGWRYVWVDWITREENNNALPEGKAVRYETIEEDADFNDLFHDKADGGQPWLVSKYCPGFKNLGIP